jgi:hypothetical protein
MPVRGLSLAKKEGARISYRPPNYRRLSIRIASHPEERPPYFHRQRLNTNIHAVGSKSDASKSASHL